MSLKIKGKHVVAALSIILLFLVIIPLFLLAPYDYASCDDFSYGIPELSAMPYLLFFGQYRGRSRRLEKRSGGGLLR